MKSAGPAHLVMPQTLHALSFTAISHLSSVLYCHLATECLTCTDGMSHNRVMNTKTKKRLLDAVVHGGVIINLVVIVAILVYYVF